MSYKELFTRYGNRYDTADVRITHTYIRPQSVKDIEHISWHDGFAAQAIGECKHLITELTEYRKDLAARYGQLATMGYNDSLLLKRYRGDSVRFELTTIRTYEDGTEKTVSRENFSGKERHKAIARYNELKKQNPQMSASMDIEKRPWER